MSSVSSQHNTKFVISPLTLSSHCPASLGKHPRCNYMRALGSNLVMWLCMSLFFSCVKICKLVATVNVLTLTAIYIIYFGWKKNSNQSHLQLSSFFLFNHPSPAPPSLQLQDRESMVTLLVGARYGVSQVVNHKLSILSTLTEFTCITRIELLPESDKVSLVKIYLQDIKVRAITFPLLCLWLKSW